MNTEQYSFNYGNKAISYNIIFVNRKTLEIAVYPNSLVEVKAPLDTSLESIKRKLHKRAVWILKQLNYFSQFKPRTPERRYIRGETHLYLGKQYRLKLKKNKQSDIKLVRGFFQISCGKINNPIIVKQLMDEWYFSKALIQFNSSFERYWPFFSRLKVKRPRLQIRTMKRRWGSLSKNGTMTLNIELIKAPKACIDYVIIHELCHLKYHNHSAKFYQLLESITPNWQSIKQKLELALL